MQNKTKTTTSSQTSYHRQSSVATFMGTKQVLQSVLITVSRPMTLHNVHILHSMSTKCVWPPGSPKPVG